MSASVSQSAEFMSASPMKTVIVNAPSEYGYMGYVPSAPSVLARIRHDANVILASIAALAVALALAYVTHREPNAPNQSAPLAPIVTEERIVVESVTFHPDGAVTHTVETMNVKTTRPQPQQPVGR